MGSQRHRLCWQLSNKSPAANFFFLPSSLENYRARTTLIIISKIKEGHLGWHTLAGAQWWFCLNHPQWGEQMKPLLPCPVLAVHRHFHRSWRRVGGFGPSSFGSWPLVGHFAQSLLGEYCLIKSSRAAACQPACLPPVVLLQKVRVLQLCCTGWSLQVTDWPSIKLRC